MPTRLCTVPGCDGVHLAKGLCRKHYDASRVWPSDRRRLTCATCCAYHDAGHAEPKPPVPAAASNEGAEPDTPPPAPSITDRNVARLLAADKEPRWIASQLGVPLLHVMRIAGQLDRREILP